MADAQSILNATGGGIEVFKHFFGDKCEGVKCFRNPYREDTRPSCRLYYNRDSTGGRRWYLQDFGDNSWCGDCFTVAAHIFNMSLPADFPQVLQGIDKELCLCVLDNPSHQKPIVYTPKVVDNPTPTVSRPLDFKVVYKPFSVDELRYWARYGISAEILYKYCVRSIAACRFFREDSSSYELSSLREEPMFAYLFNGGKGLKLYRPNSACRFLFGGMVPKPYVFGLDLLPEQGEVVYITGGEKDVMSLRAHGFDAICFNSETSRWPKETMTALANRFKHIILLYDYDETGVAESYARFKEWNGLLPIHVVYLPLAGTKQEKDISDFFALGRTADELKQLTKESIQTPLSC